MWATIQNVDGKWAPWSGAKGKASFLLVENIFDDLASRRPPGQFPLEGQFSPAPIRASEQVDQSNIGMFLRPICDQSQHE